MFKSIDVVETVKRDMVTCDGPCDEAFVKGGMPPLNWVQVTTMAMPREPERHFCPQCFTEVLSGVAVAKQAKLSALSNPKQGEAVKTEMARAIYENEPSVPFVTDVPVVDGK